MDDRKLEDATMEFYEKYGWMPTYYAKILAV
jgi:hypothetical protein